MDLVGPRDDLFDNVREELGNHDYLDPGFDADHAARWGASFRFPPPAPVEELVTTCPTWSWRC
ncbi:MAG: hypothetical protein R2734_10705 [Nocardioides sp.]